MRQSGVPFRTKFFYGLGSLAYGVKDNGFSYLLLIFYNQVLGLPAEWVGAGIMLALLVDAVTDPLVGYASDHLRSRWGRRHPFMYGSAIPVAVTYYVLWNPPEGLGPSQLFLYFITVAILVRVFVTFYEIPSTALVPELTEDYDERTSMLGYRYFFGWSGGLLMALLAFLVFLPASMGGVSYRPGYGHYAALASGLMLLGILASALGTHDRIPTLVQPPKMKRRSRREVWQELKQTLSNRSFAVLFISSLFTAMAAGVSTSLNVYFNTYFWEFDTAEIGYLVAPMFLSAGVALLLAPLISRGIGKKWAAIGVAAVAFFAAPLPITLRLLGWFPANGTETLFYTLLAFGAIEVTLIITASILISSMVADIVEESELVTGRRSEGIFFAARSFAQKAVHGIGTFLATMILVAVDFPREAHLGEVQPETIRHLGMVYVPVVMLLYVGALIFLTGYRISRESHSDNLRRLSGADG